MTNFWKVVLGSIAVAVVIQLGGSPVRVARAENSSITCHQWEVQTILLSDKDPNKRSDPHAMPTGWEPYAGQGWSIMLRRCMP